MSLVVRDLTMRYGRIEALRGVSAEAGRGRVTAVIGPNAAGKSTLLRCMIGAVTPDAGAVLVDGQPVHRLSARRLAQRVAYVAQRPSVSAAFTVRQVVELGRYALPASPSRIDEAIRRMELIDLQDRPYAELSVGQQQRVALARALAQLAGDGHLVLDEPAAAMDLRHVHETMLLLRELAARGATVMVAMHDLAVAAQYADEAWLLSDGRLIAAGAVDEVFQIGRLQSVFGVSFEWIERAGCPRVISVLSPPARAR